MKIIGYILCTFGLVYVIAGLYELLLPPPQDVFRALPEPTSPLAGVGDVILALATLFEALTKAPDWLAACVVGALLILIMGYWLIRQGLRRSPSRTFGE